jgi:DNA-binding NarL/FixJ family response regulator
MLAKLPTPAIDGTVPIDELLRSNRAFQSRLSELAAANEGLRRDAALEARRMQAIIHELALAAQLVGDRPLAGVVRAVAAKSPAAALLSVAGPLQPLSAREREVLRLLTEGSRSPSIASRLGICSATVEVHRRNIMRKLGLHSVAALTKYAVREGLTTL